MLLLLCSRRAPFLSLASARQVRPFCSAVEERTVKWRRMRWNKKNNVSGRLVIPCVATSFMCAFVFVRCSFSKFGKERAACSMFLHSPFDLYESKQGSGISMVHMATEIVVSPVGPLWLILLLVSVIFVLVSASRNGTVASRHRKGLKSEKRPDDFLPMVQWYSVMLIQTAYMVLVSLKLFLGDSI